MKRIIYFLFIILSVSYVKGQDKDKILNTGAANFLLIIPDARSAAMGGSSVALTENNNAVFFNGASILLDEDRKGGINYSFVPWMRNYESGYYLHSIGGFYKINNKNAFLGGVRYYDYPGMVVIEGGQEIEKKINPREWAIDIGYARELSANFALSAIFRYICSNMGDIGEASSAKAVAFDIGAFYKKDIVSRQEGNWAIGLHISNIGSKIKYLDNKESLPTMAKLGGMVNLPFSPVHHLIITSDLGYRFIPSDIQSFTINTGAEYILMEHFMFRVGYHYGNKDKGDRSYTTAGVGVECYGGSVNFSWLFSEKENLIRNSFWISLGYSF